MTDCSPAEALIAVAPAWVASCPDIEAVEVVLEGCIARGRAAWPELEVDANAFAVHLGRHCAEPGDLAATAIEDLYLACACALKSEPALSELLRRLTAVIERTVSRDRGDDEEEIRLAITQRLVMDEPPKIAAYTGRGPLSQWLAAAVAREAISRRRTAARRRALLDNAAVELAPADPELDFLKRHYRAEFKAAFARALDELAPGDRTVLRHRFVDELTLDQLAVASGVHRATAARWLSRIRAELLATTRRGLHERLGVDGAELDSVVGLIASNFEVSVRRLLG